MEEHVKLTKLNLGTKKTLIRRLDIMMIFLFGNTNEVRKGSYAVEIITRGSCHRKPAGHKHNVNLVLASFIGVVY